MLASTILAFAHESSSHGRPLVDGAARIRTGGRLHLAWIGLCAGSVGLACGPHTDRNPNGDTPVDAATKLDGIDGIDDGGCAAGVGRCDGLDYSVCRDGAWQLAQTCPKLCDDRHGCVECEPYSGTCVSDTTSRLCLPDGSGYYEVLCDPVQGVVCDAASGVCSGACAPQSLGSSYVGCEYYPTITGNPVASMFNFAVAVSNTTTEEATVRIEGGALAEPVSFTVPAGGVEAQKLPWIALLKGCPLTTATYGRECGLKPYPGVLLAKGAYRLRSNQPVTVYQFNPLEYQADSAATFSLLNDASLLLPANTLRGEYFVVAWPAQILLALEVPSLLAVTATEDNTSVTVTTTAATPGGNGAPDFVAGVPQTVLLNQGDVLQLYAFAGDLTGSTVKADKPVQAIGGHYCANIPTDRDLAADHLEESLFPLETLGTTYFATAPAVPAKPAGRVNVVRIVATEPSTVLVYDPPQAGAATTLANAGDYVDLVEVKDDFKISGSSRIVVAQFMEGMNRDSYEQKQAGFEPVGDPAMVLAVPVAQFRQSYLFYTPSSYQTHYVNIVAPTGAAITLDGADVTGFVSIGSSGFGVVKQQLQDGNHTIASEQPFGISVYGYGKYTSYWYPGGLDLIPVP
ncbi:MAG: IgGFc-binding protein [Pseudomonadota bacterium]